MNVQKNKKSTNAFPNLIVFGYVPDLQLSLQLTFLHIKWDWKEHLSNKNRLGISEL